jgi:hypothetical protein
VRGTGAKGGGAVWGTGTAVGGAMGTAAAGGAMGTAAAGGISGTAGTAGTPQAPGTQQPGSGMIGPSQQEPTSVQVDLVQNRLRRREPQVPPERLEQPQARPRPAATATRSKRARTIVDPQLSIQAVRDRRTGQPATYRPRAAPASRPCRKHAPGNLSRQPSREHKKRPTGYCSWTCKDGASSAGHAAKTKETRRQGDKEKA